MASTTPSRPTRRRRARARTGASRSSSPPRTRRLARRRDRRTGRLGLQLETTPMNFRLVGTAALAAVFFTGCAAARGSNLPGLDMRFYETPSGGEARQRIREEGLLNATVIGDASLRYLKPSELLKAAETEAGKGDPQKLMRAARTLEPGQGVVLLGTVRSTSASGRS